MSKRKGTDMMFMSDAARQSTDIRAGSGNPSHAEEVAETELALVLADHMPPSEVRSVIGQIGALRTDYNAGKMTADHMDRVAEQIILTAMARHRRAVAA